MVTRLAQADYLVVGAGAAGMAFVDALIDNAEVRVALLDSRHAAGSSSQCLTVLAANDFPVVSRVKGYGHPVPGGLVVSHQNRIQAFLQAFDAHGLRLKRQDKAVFIAEGRRPVPPVGVAFPPRLIEFSDVFC